MPTVPATAPELNTALPAAPSGARWYVAGVAAFIVVGAVALAYFTAPGALHLCTPRHYNGRSCTVDAAVVTRAELRTGLYLVVDGAGHRDFTGDGARLILYRTSASGPDRLVGWRDIPLDIASDAEQYDFSAIVKRMAVPNPRVGAQLNGGDSYVLRLAYNVPILGSPTQIGTTRFTYAAWR